MKSLDKFIKFLEEPHSEEEIEEALKSSSDEELPYWETLCRQKMLMHIFRQEQLARAAKKLQ